MFFWGIFNGEFFKVKVLFWFCFRFCLRHFRGITTDLREVNSEGKVATLNSFEQRGYFAIFLKVVLALGIVCADINQMSCPDPSKPTKKRKLDNLGGCEKPPSKKMAWESYNSIEDFGYEFNEEGRLVDESGDGFNFQVTENHSYNQKNYEMLGEVITEHVYTLLQSEEVGLKKIEIPLTKESSSILSFVKPVAKQKMGKDVAKGFIFASENFEQKEKLLVLVHGSGVVRAGQWARRLIINDCLDHGTQIPYIKHAIKHGYGVVVLNTNQNEALVEIKGQTKYKVIKESESPEEHFSYVWKNIIEKTRALKMFIVAHSYGGYLVVNYFSRHPKTLERVIAVAFTDSVHSLNYESRGDVRKWFLKNSVNWVTSNDDLDKPMWHQDNDNFTTRISAGTQKHEETSWKAMDSVFKYFQNKELDFDKQDNAKNIKTKGKAAVGNKKIPTEEAVEEDNKLAASTADNKGPKRLYSQAHIPVERGREQKGSDGSEQDVELGQEPSDTGGGRESKSEQVDKTKSKNKKTVACTSFCSTPTKRGKPTKPEEIDNKDRKGNDKSSNVVYVGGTSASHSSHGSVQTEIKDTENESSDGVSGESEEKRKGNPDSGLTIDKDSSTSGQEEIPEKKTDKDPSKTEDDPKEEASDSEEKKIKIEKGASNTENDPTSTSDHEGTPDSEEKKTVKDPSKTENDPTSTSEHEGTPDSEEKKTDKDPSKTENDPTSTSEHEGTPDSEEKIDKDPSKTENDPTSTSEHEGTPDSEEKTEKGASKTENDLISTNECNGTPDSEENKIDNDRSKTEDDTTSTSEHKGTPDSEEKKTDKGASKTEDNPTSTSEIKHGENSELANNFDKDASKNEIDHSGTNNQHGEKPDKKLDDISDTDQKPYIVTWLDTTQHGY